MNYATLGNQAINAQASAYAAQGPDKIRETEAYLNDINFTLANFRILSDRINGAASRICGAIPTVGETNNKVAPVPSSHTAKLSDILDQLHAISNDMDAAINRIDAAI